MDYTVAIDDVPKGEKGSKRNMAESWMEAADQHGIPTAFIVRDGKVAWIGHPMAMDEALEKISAKEFDIQVAARRYREEKERQSKLTLAQAAYNHKQFAVATRLLGRTELGSNPTAERESSRRPLRCQAARTNWPNLPDRRTSPRTSWPNFDDASANAKLTRSKPSHWLNTELAV